MKRWGLQFTKHKWSKDEISILDQKDGCDVVLYYYPNKDEWFVGDGGGYATIRMTPLAEIRLREWLNTRWRDR